MVVVVEVVVRVSSPCVHGGTRGSLSCCELLLYGAVVVVPLVIVSMLLLYY